MKREYHKIIYFKKISNLALGYQELTTGLPYLNKGNGVSILIYRIKVHSINKEEQKHRTIIKQLLMLYYKYYYLTSTASCAFTACRLPHSRAEGVWVTHTPTGASRVKRFILNVILKLLYAYEKLHIISLSIFNKNRLGNYGNHLQIINKMTIFKSYILSNYIISACRTGHSLT